MEASAARNGKPGAYIIDDAHCVLAARFQCRFSKDFLLLKRLTILNAPISKKGTRSLNPSNAQAHANLGLALVASGKPRESVPEFEVALQLKPDLKAAADGLRHAQEQLK